MKKLLFIFTLFISATSFAQTKEETIAWIKEKFEKHSKYRINEKITIVKINECGMIIRSDYTMEIYGENRQSFAISEIPFTAFLEIKAYDGSAAQLHFTAEVVKHSYSDGSSGYNNTSYFEIMNREENLYARMEKAIKHLATFCEKKKETF